MQRLDRQAVFAFQELGALAMTNRRWLLPAMRAVGRRQINKTIKDPELRRKVTPTDEIGCKRVMLTDDWYPDADPAQRRAGHRPDRQVTATGIRTADGVERPADVIVLATGFRSHEFVAPMEIVGSGGRQPEPRSGRGFRAPTSGSRVPAFPNLFLLYGPNTNGGTGSVIYTIEAGIAHVIAALRELERTGADRIELREEAAERFDRELRAALSDTVWHSGCTNWYVDERGHDPNQWPWTWSAYRRRAGAISARRLSVLDGAFPRRGAGVTSVGDA